MSRLAALFYWTTPSLLCLILYWYGFRAWFRMDDFAWLGLHTLVHDFDSFLGAMFTPLAQGSIRPLSERLFFFAGWHLFGLEAPPFRIIVFATVFACLVLLSVITRKLTNSAVAGFVAPLLWIVNGNLYTPMAWTSAYNQILCALCLLGALVLWVRYTETNESRFYMWQWVVFLLGFGALEINVVYPAIAALYALCFVPKFLTRTVPMFAVSAGYAVFHRLSAPVQKSETYRMYFDTDIFNTIRQYVQWSFGADRFAAYRGFSPVPFYAAEVALAVAMLAFTAAMVRRKRWLAVFCTGWFGITIAPVLPLKNHVSDYYLTIPLIGLAMLAAWAVSRAWQQRLPVRAATLMLLLVYVGPSAWMARGMSKQFHDESRRYSNFVRSVAYAHQVHPEQRLLIRGVDRALYYGAWADNPFRIFGLSRIYMPGSDHRDFGRTRDFLAESIALEGLKRGEILVYDVKPDGRLRNMTPLVQASWARTSLAPPEWLDLSDPLSGIALPSGWWQPETHHRWMSRRARVTLAGPSTPGELILHGRAVNAAALTVAINGRAAPAAQIAPGPFDLRFPVSSAATLDIVLNVDRSIQVPGDGRELGLMFSEIEIVH